MVLLGATGEDVQQSPPPPPDRRWMGWATWRTNEEAIHGVTGLVADPRPRTVGRSPPS